MLISVLVLEDDVSKRETLSDALEQLGYSVVAVQSNELASGSLEAVFFDVLLVSVKPGCLYAVETAIVAKNHQANLKIIVVSDATLLNAVTPHVDAIVRKPYAMRDLDDVIKHVTATRRLREYRDLK